MKLEEIRAATPKACDTSTFNENETNPELREQEIKNIQGFVFRSENPRFNEFPEHFEDWTEEQKSDAYSNNFKLYLQKSVPPLAPC